MGLSRLVPESLSDLDRCHSWAPGEEPLPQCCRIPPPPCRLPQARSMEVQAGLSHRQPPHQVGAGRPECVLVRGKEGVRMWEGMEAGEWDQGHCRVLRPLQGTKGSNGSPERTLALRCGCVYEEQSVLLC